MTAPVTVGLEPVGEERTVRKTFTVKAAPDIDSDHGTPLTPTELTITFRWSSERPPESDVMIRFGNVHGRPVRHYFALTEQQRPRPDWINAAVAPYAPEWWQA